LTIPSMASRGIHDTEVTEDSILTRAAPPAIRATGHGASHDARSAALAGRAPVRRRHSPHMEAANEVNRLVGAFLDELEGG
jgi:hypothetical protein